MRRFTISLIAMTAAAACGEQQSQSGSDAHSPQPEQPTSETSAPASASPEANKNEQLDQDLIYFSELFEGEYNNFSIDADAAQRHYLYRRVDLPAFGDHVVYVQQYYGAGEDTAAVYRQRIYASYADYKRNEIVTRIFSFPNESLQSVVDAQFDPSKLSSFTPDTMTALPEGCEIFWYRDGDNIVGYQKLGVCVMKVPNSDVTMLLSDDLLLTPASFTTFTKGQTEDGDPIFGDEKPLVMQKANILTCTVSDHDGASLTARAHDVGGIVPLSSLGLDNTVRIRRDAPTDLASPLILEIVSNNSGVATSSEPTSPPAAISTDDISVRCALDESPWKSIRAGGKHD